MRNVLSTTVILLGLSQGASASVVYSFVESGGNVIGTLSGSLSTDFQRSFNDGLIGNSGINPRDGMLISGETPRPSDPTIVSDVSGDIEGSGVDFFFVSPFQTFGPEAGVGFTAASNTYGSTFIVMPAFDFVIDGEPRSPFSMLGLSSDYVSGTPLAGGMTFLNATFDSLGIMQGDYLFEFPNVDEEENLRGSFLQDVPQNSITLSFGTAVAAVPVPATLPLLLAGLGIMGWRAGRKSTA